MSITHRQHQTQLGRDAKMPVILVERHQPNVELLLDVLSAQVGTEKEPRTARDCPYDNARSEREERS